MLASTSTVLEAGHVDIRGWPDFLYQNRLVLLKPYGSQEEARQIITRATVFIEEVFPRVGRSNVHVYVVNQKKKKRKV